MPLQFYNGQLLFVNGQLAMDPACCCRTDFPTCQECLAAIAGVTLTLGGYQYCEHLPPSSPQPPCVNDCCPTWTKNYFDVVNGTWTIAELISFTGDTKFFWHRLGELGNPTNRGPLVREFWPFGECEGDCLGQPVRPVTRHYLYALEATVNCSFSNGQFFICISIRTLTQNWHVNCSPQGIVEQFGGGAEAGTLIVESIACSPFTEVCNEGQCVTATPGQTKCFPVPIGQPTFFPTTLTACPILGAVEEAPRVTLTEFPFNGPATNVLFRWTTTGTNFQTSVRLDGGVFEPLPVGTTEKTYNNLSVGSHSFSVQVLNTAGSDQQSHQWFVTGNPPPPPTVTLTQSPPASTDQTSATFAWSTTGQIDTTVCELDGAVANCTSPTTYSGLSTGSHQFKVTVANATGSDTKIHSWTVTQPTPGPPTVTLTGTPPLETASQFAAFHWTTTGTITTTLCTIDGQPAFCTSPANYNLQPGQHTFRVDVSNSFGSDFKEYSWTITGGEPPTVCSKLVTLLNIQGTTVNADYEVEFTGVQNNACCAASSGFNNAFLISGPSTLQQGDQSCSFPIRAFDAVTGSALCEPNDSFSVEVTLCDLCDLGDARVFVRAFYNGCTEIGNADFAVSGQAARDIVDQLLVSGQAVIPLFSVSGLTATNFSNATCLLRVFT